MIACQCALARLVTLEVDWPLWRDSYSSVSPTYVERDRLNGKYIYTHTHTHEDDLLKFKPSIRMGKKGDLSDSERGMVLCVRRRLTVFQKLLIYWDFHAQPSLGFTENGPKKRKYPVSGSCVEENALLMSEVRGEWADWLEMIERQQ